MYTVEVVDVYTGETDYIVVDDLDEIDLSTYYIVTYWENY